MRQPQISYQGYLEPVTKLGQSTFSMKLIVYDS
jgi:hypothetical protein